MNMAIRADADPGKGMGHIMRALCLAQGAKTHGWEVALYTCCQIKELLARFENEGIIINHLQDPFDLDPIKRMLKEKETDWVVLDGYDFDSGYQKAVKSMGHNLAVMDDYVHLDHYYADLIINQNFGAERLSYPAEPYTKFLLGTKYVLLRSEFLRYEGHKKHIPVIARKVLVSMGGADEGNVSLKVLDAIERINSPLEVKIVLGAANPHHELIGDRAAKSNHRVTIHKDVLDMAPLMAWADVAVSAGGTTMWELAFMGVPAILIIVASNQENVVNALASEGLPSAGWADHVDEASIKELLLDLLNDKNRRHYLSDKGKKMIDGQGAARLINYFKKMRVEAALTIRKAEPKDIDVIYKLANEEEVRKYSFNQRNITSEEHREWFHGKLENENVLFLVAEADNLFIGQTRFDIDNEAVISISLKSEYRNSGIGAMVLEKAIACLKSVRPDIVMIKAFVKKGNTASRRFFEKSRFKAAVETTIKNQPAVEYRYYIGDN